MECEENKIPDGWSGAKSQSKEAIYRQRANNEDISRPRNRNKMAKEIFLFTAFYTKFFSSRKSFKQNLFSFAFFFY